METQVEKLIEEVTVVIILRPKPGETSGGHQHGTVKGRVSEDEERHLTWRYISGAPLPMDGS